MFTVDMIATSVDGFEKSLDEVGGDGSDALSRDFNIWGDKDEEEDF